MLRGDQGAHLGSLVLGIAHPKILRRIDKQLHDPVEGTALDEDPAARAAVLPGVGEDGVGSRGRRGLDVGIAEDHVGRLPAELEGDALDRPGCTLHHTPANLSRAREPDLRHVGMLDERLADDSSEADHDVYDTLRDAGLRYQLTESKGRERSQLGGLENYGVA